MLNCSNKVAQVRGNRHTRVSVLLKVAKAICFLLSLPFLMDDHSLFHADALLLSRVHYSETLTPVKKRASHGKTPFLMCFTQGHSRKMFTAFIMKKLVKTTCGLNGFILTSKPRVLPAVV